jgi:hypothetical protein
VPLIEVAEEATEIQDGVYIYLVFFSQNNIVWLGYSYRNFAC